jgi:hypothetical protein
MTEGFPPPCAFTSYSHDGRAHKHWVADLSSELRRNGVNVILDQWELPLGGDGVGYESMILTGELIRDLGTSKFIPLIRQPGGGTLRPSALQSRLYLDFSDDQMFAQNLDRLLRELHGAGAQRPPLGPNPFVRHSSTHASSAAAPADIAHSLPAHLLIPKALTDAERDIFLEDAFECMADRFRDWAPALQKTNTNIVARFQRIDARQFSAVVYRDGSAVSRCRVRLDLGSRRFGLGITYSRDDSDFNQSFEECLSADSDCSRLCLRPLGLTPAAAAIRQSRLTLEQGAELYWTFLIAPLRGLPMPPPYTC